MTQPEPPPSRTTPPVRRALTRRQRTWRAIGIAAAGLLGLSVVAANFVRVPYVIISPGEATPLGDDVVSISGAPTFDHDGNLLFLTVRVSNRDPTVLRWLFAELDGNVTVTKKEAVIGCASYEQNADLQNLLMQESQDIAKTVALRRLGYEVPEATSRIVIIDVLCGGPSEGKLALGDEIVALDGTPVRELEDIRPLIQAHRPGEPIDVTVRRDGEEETIRVRLGKEPAVLAPTTTSEAPAPRGAFLGIVSQKITDEDFPLTIDIDTRRVSGPSAGLAFTLAIIDDLTRGDLTGGANVAVTGSILPNGDVAPVGGVAQKAIAARRSGATLMLVPACAPPEPRACEASEARAFADGMKVVIVEDIGDALKALERFGGDPIPPRPTTEPAT